MATYGYLAGARQRFCEFGGFSELAPDTLPEALRRGADLVAERREPGLTTLVALCPEPDDDTTAAMMADLVATARTLLGASRVEVMAVLVIVTSRPLTLDRYQRLQGLTQHIGAVRAVPWVADLARGRLIEHQGLPFGVDPDLITLAAPEAEPRPAPRIRAAASGGKWRVPDSWATLALTAAIGVIWVAMTLAGGSIDATKQNEALLVAWGAAARPELWISEEYWRLLTAAFIHIGVEHLAMNGISLWFVGRAVEVLYGPVRLLVIYLIAAIAGGVASAVLGPPNVLSAGASGAVYGLLGAVIWYRLSSPLGYRIAWRPLLLTLGLNLAFGLALYKVIDNWNHLGGLVGGMVAAMAVGVPHMAGLPKPRLRLAQPVHGLLALALLAVAALPVTGAVTLPGPGRELARSFQAFEEGRVADAEAGVRGAVRRQPDEPNLRFLLARIYFLQGKCLEAEGELDQLLRLVSGRHPDILLLQDAVQDCLR